MSAPDIDFARGEASPALPPGFRGVRIRVEARSDHGSLRALRLHGVYQVAVEEAEAIGARPLQRALVVTATSGLLHASWNLCGETITFPDDEQVTGGIVRGYFNADLLRRFSVAPFRTGYVMVSLGPLLSNIEAFTAS